MPSSLAPFLAARLGEFAQGQGWRAEVERPLFGSSLAHRLGFNPQPDLLLTASDGARLAMSSR
jgi:hypothetical protein